MEEVLFRTRKSHKAAVTISTYRTQAKQDKSKANIFKDLIESSNILLSFAWRLGLLYGGFWLFFYCFFVIRFFPIGVTPTDGLFLIAIALGFGLLIAFLGGMGFFICKPLFAQADQSSNQPSAQRNSTEPTFVKYRSPAATLILASSIILQILLCLLYHESNKPNTGTTAKVISEFINASPLRIDLFSYAFLSIPLAIYPICSFIIFRFGLNNNSWSSIALTAISWALYIVFLPLMIEVPEIALLSLRKR